MPETKHPPRPKSQTVTINQDGNVIVKTEYYNEYKNTK